MSSTKTSVLVVEDDPTLRSLLYTVLTQSGYHVRSAEDGFQALDELRDELPDLILSDLYMAGMSGFELLSVVRRRFPAIQVVAMSSAYSGPGVPAGIVADAFYAKEGNPSFLLRVVADLKDRKANPPPRQDIAQVPIWLETDKKTRQGEMSVLLTCPECLRGFPQLVGDGAPTSI